MGLTLDENMNIKINKALNEAQDAFIDKHYIEESIEKDKYIFKGQTSFDIELYKKFTKEATKNIAIGNFSRLALDKVKECIDISYPTESTDAWQIEPLKVTAEIQVVIMSTDELDELIKDIIDKAHSYIERMNKIKEKYWEDENPDTINKLQKEKEDQLIRGVE